MTTRVDWNKLFNKERYKTEEFVEEYTKLKQECRDRMEKDLDSKGIKYEIDRDGNAVVRWGSYSKPDMT
jgi:hypothetical protein